MKCEWKTLKLGDIAEFNKCTYSVKDDWKFVNYLDTGNITENRIEAIQYIDLFKESLPSRAKRKVKNCNIIYSTVRPNQLHYGYIKEQPNNFLVSTGFAVIDVNEKFANSQFIYYFLTQNRITDYLHSIAEQSVSAYPSIKSSDLADVEINLPDLETQKKIAKILSSLDDKIELNNAINHNLQQQAQAIYEKMFIDTENIERRICRAEQYFNISIGKTPPRKEPEWFKDNRDDNIVWVSIADMGNSGLYISDSSEYLTTEAIENFNVTIVPDNTVLLSFKLTVGRIAISDGELATNEAIAHFKTKNKEINEYLYFYLKKYNFQSLGSTSSIATAVNSKIIKAMPFIVPTDEELKEYHKATFPLFEKIKINQRENNKLFALRDTLLPKLMSGELDVSEVEI